MSYCALDEAFLGPPAGTPSVKRHKKYRPKEAVVPAPLPDVPAGPAIESEDVLAGSPSAPVNRLQATQGDNFFPLPGSDSWESAFLMDSDFTKTVTQQKPESVAGKPTLWREIPEVSSVPASVMADVNRRLDILTKQLESLNSHQPSAAQGTAELFLFVAIGLLLLLAIDTLLRFATTMSKQAPTVRPTRFGMHSFNAKGVRLR